MDDLALLRSGSVWFRVRKGPLKQYRNSILNSILAERVSDGENGENHPAALVTRALAASDSPIRQVSDRRSPAGSRTFQYIQPWGTSMKKLDERTAANLDVVLEDVCRSLPNYGGDHESRKFIAVKLVRAAQRGRRTLGTLEVVARQALRTLSRRRRA